MPAFTKAMLDKLGLTPAALTTLQAVPHPLFTVQKNSILTCLLSLVNRSNVMAALLARRVRVNLCHSRQVVQA
jgi:hypothetical protein